MLFRFRNSIFNNKNRNMQQFEFVPDGRGLRRQKNVQHRPEHRPQLTHIAHNLMVVDRPDAHSNVHNFPHTIFHTLFSLMLSSIFENNFDTATFFTRTHPARPSATINRPTSTRQSTNIDPQSTCFQWWWTVQNQIPMYSVK